ncbi:MAG: right-handed parallel beta-helix repeat-containing protein, partial [Clostridia bacterium]|nr:right-handed parallel beta-helix repeat-containing protein [Clostridia bacterium]
FSPDRDITRQELATMFKRYADFKDVNTSVGAADISSFPDATSVADWASDAVKWAVGVKLITGKSNNGGAATISPSDKAVRAEFATIIKRFKEADFEYHLVYNSPVVKGTYTEKPYEKVENADVYVAVDGNDTNPGTKDKPLATFEAAKLKVRELKKTAKDEIVVAFKAGDYGVLDNVSLSAEDSGSEKVPVTYCAYGDGEVYFTNGVYVNANEFKHLDKSDEKFFSSANISSIKKADLSGKNGVEGINENSNIFNVDGFVIPARFPNKVGFTDKYIGLSVELLADASSIYTREQLIAHAQGEVDLEGVDESREGLKAFIDQNTVRVHNNLKSKLDSYRTLDGVQICGYISKVWAADNLPIASYDKTTGILDFTESPIHGFVHIDDNNQQVYIENASEELDVYGEYWLDTFTKTLYVYAPQGEYMITTHGTFVTFVDAEYITLRKLNFRGCSFNGDYVGAINVETASDNFTFDRCSMKYIGTYYALHLNRCINTTVTGCEIAYCYFTAIEATAPRDKYNDEFNMADLESSGLVIENNLIHDVALMYVGVEASGIHYDHHVGVKVAHNEIYNSSRYAISSHHNIDSVIEYNYIHECMQNSADGGSIYFASCQIHRGNIIRYNIIANGCPDSPVHIGGIYAVYLDDFHSNAIIYDNIIYNSGNAAIMDNNGRDHDVHNNVIITTAKNNGGFVAKGEKFYDIETYYDVEEGSETRNFLLGTNKYSIPDKNSEKGQEWLERWPELYDIQAILKDPDCYKDTYLYTKSAGSW